MVVLAALLIGLQVFGYKITQLNSWDYTGFVEDSTAGHTKIYTVDQEKAVCYVAVINGQNRPPATGISCLPKIK